MKKLLHKKINFEFEKISSLSTTRNFSVNHKSTYPTAKSEITICKKKDNNYFNFELTLNKKLLRENFIFKKLGFNEDFEIVADKQSYIIPSHSISRISSKRFVESDKVKGDITVIYSNSFQINKKAHFRLIIEVSEDHLTTILSGEGYKCEETTYGHGYTKIIAENIEYHIFRYDIEGKNYLIIECYEKTNFLNFKNVCDLIIKVIAFLTGNWYQKEYFIFSYNSNKFINSKSFYFESLGNSVITNQKMINPSEFREFIDAKKNIKSLLTDHFFPSNIFSKLIENLIIKKEFERALELIIEGKSSSSAIIKCSVFHVALETIIGLIHKGNKKFFEPIKNTDSLEKIKGKLQSIIDKSKDEINELEYEVLSKKIKYLNSPFNKDRMIKAFELFNIELPKELKKILSSRNDFLHGKTPYKEHLVKTKIKELNLDADRIHLLVSILILRYVGYKGHIKNFAGYRLASEIYYNEADDNNTDNDESIYYKL